jgi:hypothetical protein
MAPHSFVLDVWLAGLVIQFSLAISMMARNVWAKFPIFAMYVLYTLGESVIAYVSLRRPGVFVYAYVLGEGLSVILGVALVYEVFVHLFSLHAALRRLARTSFQVVLALLVVFAGIVIYSKTPISRDGLFSALLLVEEAARILEVGLITFLFLFSGVFGLHWRQSIFGITLGLGIPSVAELVAVTVAPRTDLQVRQLLNLAHLACFDLGLLIWLTYVLMPERVTVAREIPKRAQLEQWNQAVMELIHQ